MVAEWWQCFRDLQVHHKKEPKNQYIDNKDRPDIIVYDSGIGANVELDFFLAHPFSTRHSGKSIERGQICSCRKRGEKINNIQINSIQGHAKPPSFH